MYRFRKVASAGAPGVALLAAFLWAAPSPAQDPGPVRGITLAVTLAHIAERDVHATPLAYDGIGTFFQLGYARRAAGYGLAIRLGGGGGTLRSAITVDNLPRELSLRSWFETEYSRRMSGTGQTRWQAGALLSAHLAFINHVYASLGRDEIQFGLFAVSIGPTLAVEHSTGPGGILSARLAIPLLAAVGRPYSNLRRIPPSGTILRVTSLNTYRRGALALGYVRRLGSAADFVLGYRLMVERYDDGELFQFASQGLTLGLALHTGSGGA